MDSVESGNGAIDTAGKMAWRLVLIVVFLVVIPTYAIAYFVAYDWGVMYLAMSVLVLGAGYFFPPMYVFYTRGRWGR